MTSAYETHEGTQPAAHAVHEPRTVHRVVTPGLHDANHDLHMMSEIGDGVFVQWTNCRRCLKKVYDCKCAEGPQEPDYIKRWRDNRFEKSLNERPDPAYELLPSITTWLEERGYSVTKNAKDEPAATVVPDEPPLTPEEEEEAAWTSPEAEDERIIRKFNDDDEVELVDNGLDEALERVREAKRDEDVGF